MVKKTLLPELVISKAPLRISFAGGGTDLEEYYRTDYGAVLSTTIDKFVYVTVKRHGELFKENYRLNYAETEHAKSLGSIKNDIARECLRLVQIEPPIYISTIADVPAASGLGSSSSFAIALLKALHAMKGQRISSTQLAEEAIQVEIEILKRPIGKQDHVAAAYGGLNYFKFSSDGGMSIEPHSPTQSNIEKLFKNTLMFWTGMVRDAAVVLKEQKRNTKNKLEYLDTMRDQAFELNALMRNDINVKKFGEIMNKGWQLKRGLAKGISNEKINGWYERGIHAGAFGGKICGAGGGGFLLFIAPKSKHREIRKSLSELEEIDIKYEPTGVKLLVSS